MISLRFRLAYRKGPGLKDVPKILGTELRGGLEAVGKRLKSSSASRMRRNTGAEIKSLTDVVQGRGLNLNVVVYSTMIRAFIDAYGMRPGTRVPYGKGSRIYAWALSKAKQVPRKKRANLHLIRPYAGAGPKRVFQPGTYVRTVYRIKGGTAHKSRVTTSAKIKGSERLKARERDAERLAYFAARKILRMGIKASNWNRAALEANKVRIVREMRNAMSRAVVKMTRGY